MFKVNTGADISTIYTETVLQTLVSLLHFELFTELLNGYLQVFVSKNKAMTNINSIMVNGFHLYGAFLPYLTGALPFLLLILGELTETVLWCKSSSARRSEFVSFS